MHTKSFRDRVGLSVGFVDLRCNTKIKYLKDHLEPDLEIRLLNSAGRKLFDAQRCRMMSKREKTRDLDEVTTKCTDRPYNITGATLKDSLLLERINSCLF